MAEWSLLNGASERQIWDLPTHQPIKGESDWRLLEKKKPFILASLNPADPLPKHSSRNGTREEQISLYFVPPSPERGLPSTRWTERLVVVLADPVFYTGLGSNSSSYAPSKSYFDKRPSASIGEEPGSTARFVLEAFQNLKLPDDCGPHAVHKALVSTITTLIRDDAITAIMDMKNEMKAINSGTLSGIQEQLFVYRQAVKFIFATQSAFLTNPNDQETSHASPLLFKRGLFAEFGDDYDANKYSHDLLRLIDETLNQATESFNTLRTTLSIYESQQAIAQASAINRLTEMVFIFIPLSFSTSIFGMQIKEFDNIGLGTWGIIAGVLLGAILVLRVFASSRVYEALKAGFLDWVRDTQDLPPGSNVAALDGAIALVRHRVLVIWAALILVISFVPAFVWAYATGASASSKIGWTIFSILIPGAFGFFFPRFFVGRDRDYAWGFITAQVSLSVFFIVVLPATLLPPLWLAMDAALDAAIAWTAVICSLSAVSGLYWLDRLHAKFEDKGLTNSEVWAVWKKTQRRGS